ncbi:hypothetical protein C0995_008000 [Termitomyces sp. Mi166|nr:hypothetical protein C0995_008000 [Termitomyces sp. Mi166\
MAPPPEAKETHGHILYANGMLERNSHTYGLPRQLLAMITIKHKGKSKSKGGKALDPIPIIKVSNGEDNSLPCLQELEPVSACVNVPKVPAMPVNSDADGEEWLGIERATAELFLQTTKQFLHTGVALCPESGSYQ